MVVQFYQQHLINTVIAASFGGFNRINFSDEGYEVLPVIISPERKRKLNQNLMMFFTGFTRFSSDVQKANTIGKLFG